MAQNKIQESHSAERRLHLTVYFAAALGIILRAIFVNRGLMHGDESWFLYILRELPRDLGSVKFHLLFNNCFDDNIWAIRLCYTAMSIAGNMVLALGLSSFQKDRTGSTVGFIWAFAAVSLGQIHLPEVCVVYYTSLCRFILEVSIGLVLLGVNRKRGRWICFALAGILCAMLPAVKFPSAVAIPVLLVLIALLSHSRTKDILAYCAGIACSAAIYFTLQESPAEMATFVHNETAIMFERGSSMYGVLFFCRWMGAATAYVFKLFLAAVAVWGVSRWRKLKWWIAVPAFAAIMAYVWMMVRPGYDVSKPFYDLVWVGVFYFLINGRYGKSMDKLAVLTVLLLSPLICCLGTNISYAERYTSFACFLTAAFLLLPDIRTKEYKYVSAVALMLAAFTLGTVFGEKWDGSKRLGQNIELRSLGIDQKVKVSRETVELLEFCRKNIPEGSDILVDKHFWICPELLDYNVKSSSYRLPELVYIEQFASALAEGNEIWLLLYINEEESDQDQTETLEKVMELHPGSLVLESGEHHLKAVRIRQERLMPKSDADVEISEQ